MGFNKREGRLGAVFENIYGDEAKVIDYVGATEVYIMFTEYPYKHKVEWSDLKKGHFKNVMKPLISGVGFVGGSLYKTKTGGYHTPAYRSWQSMINRCYDTTDLSYSRYGGAGVLVDSTWHNFQNFAEWYYKELEGRESKGLQLDKDILSPHGELFYSKDTCCLMPSSLNTTITECKSSASTGIKGIRKLPSGKWNIRITDTDGKFKNFGTFKNLNTAKMIWANRKYEIVKDLCQKLHKEGLIKSKELNVLSDKDWFYQRFFDVTSKLSPEILENYLLQHLNVCEKIRLSIENADYNTISKAALVMSMDKIKEDLENRQDIYADLIFNGNKKTGEIRTVTKETTNDE